MNFCLCNLLTVYLRCNGKILRMKIDIMIKFIAPVFIIYRNSKIIVLDC